MAWKKTHRGCLAKGSYHQIKLDLPLKGNDNREMEDGRENMEGGGSDVRSHWCYYVLFLNLWPLCHSAAGKWA